MRFLKLFLPFLLIFLSYLVFPRVLATIAQTPLAEYNEALNGAQILALRSSFANGEFPTDCDIFFVGTSRTLADYDPTFFANELADQMDLPQVPCAINLGNLANSPIAFHDLVRTTQLKPTLLILEFSPHIFFRDSNDSQPANHFEAWREQALINDLFISGKLHERLGLEASLKIDPAAIFLLFQNMSSQELKLSNYYYYLAATTYLHGQTYQANGQVLYRTYLPGPAVMGPLENSIDTEYDNFVKSYSNQPFNEDEWEAYRQIITNLSPENIILVRPSVSEKMYLLEDNEFGPVLQELEVLLSSSKIIYLDQNPHQYSTLDESHIDWYYTQAATRDLAREVAELLSRDLFLGE